jgi:hypothetical protein
MPARSTGAAMAPRNTLKWPFDWPGARWTRGSITVWPRPCAARLVSIAARISSSLSASSSISRRLRKVT